MTVPIVLRTMCVRIARDIDPPMPRIATTYSRVRRDRASPRISRDVPSQDRADMMMIRTGTVGGIIVAMSMKRNRTGTDMSASTMRIMIASIQPPTKPAIAPYRVPIVVAMMPAKRPTMIEVCPPFMRRPSWS